MKVDFYLSKYQSSKVPLESKRALVFNHSSSDLYQPRFGVSEAAQPVPLWQRPWRWFVKGVGMLSKGVEQGLAWLWDKTKWLLNKIPKALGLKPWFKEPFVPLPLLKLENYVAPTGLETVEKRREKTVELVNAVFPELLRLMETADKDPLWQVKFNKIFNEEVNKRLIPNSWVTIYFSEPGYVGDTGSSYYPRLDSRRVKECFDNGDESIYNTFHGSFPWASHHPFYDDKVEAGMSEALRESPRYYLGQISILRLGSHKDEASLASLYSTMLHEVNHFIRDSVNGQKQRISALKRMYEVKLDRSTGYRIGQDLFNVFLKDQNDSPQMKNLIEDLEENFTQYLKLFQKFEAQKEHYIRHTKPVATRLLYYCRDLPKHATEDLQLFLREYCESELEAYLTSKERYSTARSDNPMDSKKPYPVDLRAAITTIGFQALTRYVEDLLKLPKDGRSTMTDEPLKLHFPVNNQEEGTTP